MAERRRSCGVCGGSHLINERCPVSLAKEKQRNKDKNVRNAEDNKFLKSTEWRKFTKRIKIRDGKHCLRCLHNYGIINDHDLTVHHIKARSIYNGKNGYPDLRLDENNCVTLCRSCNSHFGTTDKLDFPFEPEEQEFHL